MLIEKYKCFLITVWAPRNLMERKSKHFISMTLPIFNEEMIVDFEEASAYKVFLSCHVIMYLQSTFTNAESMA